MSEGSGDGGRGTALLSRAVDTVLAERPVELPAPVAVDRCRDLIVACERLDAARLAAIGDLDRRELFTLEAAGSAKTWLARQLGGESGQVVKARRLEQHEQVWQAQAMGELSGRGAGALCSALDKVPAEVEEAVLQGVLVDGLQDVLGRQLGRGLPTDVEPTAEQLALRAELASVVGDALAADALAAPQRLEPALLLVARETAPAQLAWTLKYLLDALVPDGIDPPDARELYLDLVPALDGEWDLRGHLDHETGRLLQDELARQQRAREASSAAAARETAAREAESDADRFVDVLEQADARDAAEVAVNGDRQPARLPSKSRLRHDDLTQLLRDAADRDAGQGQPAPVSITLIGSIEAVEGRAGALPGMLMTDRQPLNLSAEALQRMGCFSELTAVLVDGLGRPIEVSTTRRTADRRQRAALQAVWGSWCAVAGCRTTQGVVPHHAEPWWKTRQSILRDLVPFCRCHHHDVHEGRRTLRLKDGRLLDGNGWVTEG